MEMLHKVFIFLLWRWDKIFLNVEDSKVLFFKSLTIFGVRSRWQWTRALSLFSSCFSIASKSGSGRDLNPLLSCLQVLIFLTSCERMTLFLYVHFIFQQVLHDLHWIFGIRFWIQARNAINLFFNLTYCFGV